MKLFSGDEKVYEELKKLGKTVFIKKEEKEIKAEAEDIRVASKMELLKVLECLADFGYDFAVLSFSEVSELEEKLGIKIPTFENEKAIETAPELETLRTVVEKVKENAETCGAVGVFVGFVRKIESGKTVKRLEYEAFNEILNEKIAEVERKVRSFPGIKNVKLYHKLGKLKPGEDIVYIAVAGEHRENIWEPLVTAVELMKTELPIWKKEIYEDGERWV